MYSYRFKLLSSKQSVPQDKDTIHQTSFNSSAVCRNNILESVDLSSRKDMYRWSTRRQFQQVLEMYFSYQPKKQLNLKNLVLRSKLDCDKFTLFYPLLTSYPSFIDVAFYFKPYLIRTRAFLIFFQRWRVLFFFTLFATKTLFLTILVHHQTMVTRKPGGFTNLLSVLLKAKKI
jgi:hypothetical protein